MKVKIKQGNEMLDATIEMVDGVMVVSPKGMKLDVTKFNDGDVITGGSKDDGGLSWTFILKGEIEHFHGDYKFAEEYVSLDSNGSFEINSYSDAIKWYRPATEEEKKELFDKLAEEGYEWKAETKELVKLKWEPKEGGLYYAPFLYATIFQPHSRFFTSDSGTCLEQKNVGWCFKTPEECERFCEKLNKKIKEVEP
jgi:hypothetical protein